MKIKIEYSFSYYKKQLSQYEKILNKIASKVFEITNNTDRKEIIFDCSFVSENKIQEINKDFRHKDYVTDVISFALWDSGIKTDLLGELYICYKKIQEQAKKYNHSFKRELCFLFVHGLLHLLGYDHENESDEKKMFSLQEEILDFFDIRR